MDELLIEKQVIPKLPNLLPWAIVSTICCCLPLGIMAIIYTEKALSYHHEGDFERSQTQIRMAKLWLLWAFILGIAFQLVNFMISGLFYSVLSCS